MVTPGVGLAPLLAAWVVPLLSAAAVVLVGLWWRERRARKSMRRQLKLLAGTTGQSPVLMQELLRRDEVAGGWAGWVMRHIPVFRNADELFAQAGLDWTRSRLARLMVTWGAGGGILGGVLTSSGSWWMGATVAGALLPPLYVLRSKARRMRQIEAQLPEVIDLLSRAIRAGHTIGTGIGMVAEDGPQPLAGEFRRVFEETKYGRAFQESLLDMVRRVDLVDIRVMVVAIMVQREVGGNLAEVLDNISHLIRSRFTLRQQIQVYAAQGRMSGYVLGALPIGIGFLIGMLNPTYIQVLFEDPAGKAVLMVAGLMQLTGYFWIWRILKIDL